MTSRVDVKGKKRSARNWRKELNNERSDCIDAITFVRVRLNQIIERTSTSIKPNQSRTNECCQLLHQVSASLGRFSSIMAPLCKELLLGVYMKKRPRDGSGAEAVPYFEAVQELREESRQLQQNMRCWRDKRLNMEGAEARRVLLLERSANKWRQTLIFQVFRIWKSHVRLTTKQRSAILKVFNRWDSRPGLLELVFRSWKRLKDAKEKERIENDAERWQQRCSMHRLAIDEANASIDSTEIDCQRRHENLLALREHKTAVMASLRDAEQKLAHSRGTHVNQTITSLLDMFVRALQQLEIEIEAVSTFGINDPLQIVQELDSDDTVGSRSVAEEEKQLNVLNEQEILLLWVNHHLRAVTARPNGPVENFSTDFSNGVVLLQLVQQTHPTVELSDVDWTSASTRIESFLKLAPQMNNELQKLLSHPTLLNAVNADVTAAFLACWFSTNAALEIDQTRVHNQILPSIWRSTATLRELRAQSETREQPLSIDDFFDALDRVEVTFEGALSFLQRSAASERRFAELQRRMRRFVLRVLSRRAQERPISVVDLRKRRNYAHWTHVNEDCVALEMERSGDKRIPPIIRAVIELWEPRERPTDASLQARHLLMQLFSIRQCLRRNHVQLERVFAHYAKGDGDEEVNRISFLEFWIFAKDCQLLSSHITALLLRSLFDETALESGADTELDAGQFLRLLLKLSAQREGDGAIGSKFCELIEENILMFGTSAVQQLDEDSGKQNPTVLQLCSTYWQRLASLFCSFTTNDGGVEEDVLLLIMRADELRRFYDENGLSTLGVSQDDVLELAIQTKQRNLHGVELVANDIELTFPEFLDTLVCLSEIQYPNPFEESGNKFRRFLTEHILSPRSSDAFLASSGTPAAPLLVRTKSSF